MTRIKKKFKKLWDFFDGHIRCINLTTRKDRYRESKAVFDKYHIPVKYFHAKKHSKGGVYGCFDSHIKIIREAYFAGAADCKFGGRGGKNHVGDKTAQSETFAGDVYALFAAGAPDKEIDWFGGAGEAHGDTYSGIPGEA